MFTKILQKNKKFAFDINEFLRNVPITQPKHTYECNREVLQWYVDSYLSDENHRVLIQAKVNSLKKDSFEIVHEPNVVLYGNKMFGRYTEKRTDSKSRIPEHTDMCKMIESIRGGWAGCPSDVRDSYLKVQGYIDFDIYNCHPSIVAEIIKESNIQNEFPTFMTFVTNRQGFIDTITKKLPMDKKLMKKMLLNILNGGGIIKFLSENNITRPKNARLPKELLDYSTECECIRDYIITNNQELYTEFKRVKTGDADDLSFFSYCMQNIERMIVDDIISFVQKYEHTRPIVQIHDGLQMCCTTDSNVILNDINQFLNMEYIRFEIKPHDTVDIPTELLTKKRKNTVELEYTGVVDYTTWRESFNQTHFVYGRESVKVYSMVQTVDVSTFTNENGNVCIVPNVTDDIVEYNIQSHEHMCTDFYLDDTGKKQNCIKRWRSDAERTQVHGFVYNCMLDNGICDVGNIKLYNRHKPDEFRKTYKSANESSDDVLFFVEFFRGLFEKQEDYAYFMNYISFMIQNPGIKTGIMLILLGRGGGGKSTVLRLLEKLISEVYSTSKLDTVFGRFNANIAEKRLITLEEPQKASWKNEYNTQLYDIITNTNVVCEEKFVKTESRQNPCNVVCAINEFFINPELLHDGGRRIALLQTTSTFFGNRELFTRLYQIMDNKESLNDLYKYFMTYSCNVPELCTSKLKEQTMDNTCEKTKEFMNHILFDSGLVSWENNIPTVSAKDDCKFSSEKDGLYPKTLDIRVKTFNEIRSKYMTENKISNMKMNIEMLSEITELIQRKHNQTSTQLSAFKFDTTTSARFNGEKVRTYRITDFKKFLQFVCPQSMNPMDAFVSTDN